MTDTSIFLSKMKISDVFSLDQTFSCGQCFRWERLDRECWRGTAYGKTVTFYFDTSYLYASCDEAELSAFWAKYLDLDRDYAAIRRAVSVDAQTARYADSGAGIRILRQEPWEALISFIISQCNNIPRIQGIISRLCALYGEKIDGGFAFPTPEALSRLSIEDLAPLRCGYRAPYILSSAQAVSGGSLDLAVLESADTETILRALLALPGVGIKVASCVLLFGFHRLEAFPVDTWIRKALKQDYGPDFDPAKAFGLYAGIAQQYIFYHARGKNLA